MPVIVVSSGNLGLTISKRRGDITCYDCMTVADEIKHVKAHICTCESIYILSDGLSSVYLRHALIKAGYKYIDTFIFTPVRWAHFISKPDSKSVVLQFLNEETYFKRCWDIVDDLIKTKI